MISKGSYEHAWLGITGRSMTTEIAEAMKLNPDQRGALVVEVDPNGPSAKAGLKASNDEITLYGQTVEIGGDIIIDIDGYPIKEFEDLAAYLARYGEVGKTVQLTVLRNGKEMKVSVTLMARPTSKSIQQTTTKSWLGITGITLDAELISAMSLPEGTKGVLTIEVNENSPASKAGIRAGTKAYTYKGEKIKIGGDIITKFDNINITTIGQLRSIIENVQPGTKVKLEVIRDGKTQVIEVTLEANPTQ